MTSIVETSARVRRFESADVAELISMVVRAGNFSNEEVAIAEELLGLCAAAETNDYHTFVAVEQATPVGFVILGQTPATAATYDMYWIVVDADHHGKGIGSFLERFAEEWVRGRSGTLIIAETSSKESYARTRAFYESKGYQRLAEVEDYYGPNDHLIWYGKRISK